MRSFVPLLLLVAAGPLSLPAQVPDSLPVDSVPPVPSYNLRGVTVRVPRAITAAGGVSAVEVRLDSMSVVPAPTMEQLLREMPLVQIRENSRGEAQPALRGSEDRQIAVLMDGVPLTLGWDHRTDLSVIPLTAATSVELLRGLPSVLYGPNVLGGVVQVDVARADTRLTPPTPLALSVAVDETGGTTLAVTGGRLWETGNGQWMFRAGAGFRDRPGFKIPDLRLPPDQEALLTRGDGLRLNSDFRHADGFFATRYRADDGQWMAFTGAGYVTEKGVPPEFQESGPRFWRYPDESRFLGALSAGTGLRATRWGEGDLEASIGLDVGSFQIDAFDSTDYATIEETELGDDRTITVRLLGDHTLGSRADLRSAFTYGDVSHDETLDPGGLSAYRQRLWSLGSEVELRPWDGASEGRATRINLGAVVDGADTPESGDKPPLERLWNWGARIGVSTLVAEDWLLHGGVSRRVRFPSLRELYSGALGRFLPNPDLRPEALTGGELGFTATAGDHDLQVVGFHQVLSDGIVRISVDTPEGSKRQRVNRDRVRSTGLEILASGRLGPLAYAGDVTWQSVWQFDDTDAKLRPEYEPEVAGKLNVSAPLPHGASGSALVRYMGRQFCLDTDSGGLDRLAPSGMLDLEVRRVFDRGGRVLSKIDVLAALTNVTDGPVFDQCGLPQPGRTFRLQVRLF